MSTDLLISQISVDGGTQQRPLDSMVVERYAQLMSDGFEFPPVSVVFDGKHNYLYDGFHRLHARQKVGEKKIAADIEKGRQRDAVWKSFAANKANAFPRQPGTVKEIIKKILADKEWSATSMRQIANWVGVVESYVRKVRDQMESSPEDPPVQRQKQPTEPKAEKPKAKPKAQGVTDGAKQPVPPHLEKVFSRTDEVAAFVASLKHILGRLTQAKDNGDNLYHHLKLEPVTGMFGDLVRALESSAPYAVCPYCGGDGDENCKTCAGLGWVTKLIYSVIPAEMKGGA